MKKLLDLGCEKMLLCIGGSGTNEGGIGMLEALGFRFLNAGFQPVEATARHLEKIYYVEEDSVHPQVHNCQFYVACDVQNPLLGKAGATSVFGPQKGIGPVLGGKLEKGLEHLANITQRASGIDFASLPGAGAAGGMGFGAAAYLGAELKPGAELVMQLSGLETAMASADLLITGEGRLDAQTFMGKGPGRLALQAVKQGVRVWAFGGMVDVPAEGKAVFSRTFAVKPPYMPLEQAMRKKQAYTNLKQGAAKAWEQFCTNL